MQQSEKLMACRCRLMTCEPWYGHFAMQMVWYPNEMNWLPEAKRTMGVRIVNGGEIQCIYYPPFVDSLTMKELYGVIQHEIEHIVRCHCVRSGCREPEPWNIAADMCCNGARNKPRIGYLEESSNNTILPFKGEIVWIPTDWPQDGTAEAYYERLMKNRTGGGGGKGKGKGKGQQGQGNDPNGQQGQGDGDGDDGPAEYNYGGVSGRAIDDHSTWNQSDVSADEARQIVKNAVDAVAEKAQGHVPGHLAEVLKELGKPVVRWRELLRRYLGKHVGNHRTTYSRRNRRHDQFGLPGISRHAAANVNVIIDTSGSVGTRELEQFFAEIDMISARAKVMVLQWDHAFQGYKVYRRGDWKGFKVHGRGGTDMAAPVEWLCENRLVADVQVMLTDGHCNWAKNKKFPFITVITTDQPGPGWGHCVHLKMAQ